MKWSIETGMYIWEVLFEGVDVDYTVDDNDEIIFTGDEEEIKKLIQRVSIKMEEKRNDVDAEAI